MTHHDLGVHSETGQLRQVMVCRPGRAHRRLTPDNCEELLFDDVFWVKQAQKDHDAFAELMRGEGVEAKAVGQALGGGPANALGLEVEQGPQLHAVSLPDGEVVAQLQELAAGGRITLLAETLDDAAGEAFDKAAVILDAGYPGGPAIQRLAERGDPTAEDFPRSLLEPDSLDFSFSGLKTALLYRVRGQPVGRGKAATFERDAGDLGDRERADIAASFQQAIIGVVVTKLTRALDRMAADAGPARSLIVGGGVSANAPLRAALARLAADRGLELHIPPMALCVDNAAMIAGLAHHHLQAGDTATLDLPAVATTAM